MKLSWNHHKLFNCHQLWYLSGKGGKERNVFACLPIAGLSWRIPRAVSLWRSGLTRCAMEPLSCRIEVWAKSGGTHEAINQWSPKLEWFRFANYSLKTDLMKLWNHMKSIEWSIAIFFGDASFNQQTVVAWSWVFHPAGCTQLFHRSFRFGQVPKSGAASPSVAWRSWSAWMLADSET